MCFEGSYNKYLYKKMNDDQTKERGAYNMQSLYVMFANESNGAVL